MKTKKIERMIIDRSYKITSKEIKEKLQIEGEILFIHLWRGRSPNDIEKGVSPDNDQWEISTTEVIKQ